MKYHAPGRAAVAVASLTLVLSAVPARALVEIGGGVLNISTVGTITYDDNIKGQTNEQNDIIASVTPTFTYKRAEGRIKLELHAMSSFASYNDASNENHTDYSVGGSANFPFADGSPLSGGASIETAKTTAVQELAGDLVTTKSFSLASNLSYQPNERIGYNGSASWSTQKNQGFGDNDTFSANLGISMPQALFSRLPLTGTYGFTKTKSANDTTTASRLNNKSHSFSLGTNGKLTARTSGSINVGWQTTQSDGLEATNGDTSNINLGTNLTWQASELLTATLSANRGITASPTNDTILNTSVSLSFARKLSHQLDSTLSLSQSWNDFQNVNRSDKNFSATGGLTYQINRDWSASATATHSKNSSDQAGRSFSRNLVALSINFLL